MKVYIGCFGSGLGHATRMLEIAAELRKKKAAVEFSSSGEVASLIEDRGYRCNRLSLADVRYSESGAFQVKETLLASPSILAHTYEQLGSELANISHFGPDVVLSDSALPTVIAGKILGLPTYTVLNQLNLTSSHGDRRVLPRLLSVGTSASMGKLWELSDEVLLPDLPPPYTISERNLWGTGVGRTRYVGFLQMSNVGQPDTAAVEFSAAPRPRVFWQVSGPPKTRPGFLKRALECAQALSEQYTFVVSAGNPTGSRVPSRIPGGWFYEWCEIADFYFRACDVVISRAGHGTIGQAIMNAKPSLIVPIPKQSEQEGNALKAVRLGVSLRLSQNELNPSSVRAAIGTLLEPGLVARSEKLGAWASKYNARDEIVRVIEAAACRQGRPR